MTKNNNNNNNNNNKNQELRKLYTSFDTTSTLGKIMLMNAQSGASFPLKNLDGDQQLRVTNVLVIEESRIVDGETKVQEVTTIFDDNGNSYAGISATIAKSAKLLIDNIFDGSIEWVDVRIVKQKSNAQREFLNLVVVNVG